MSFKTNILFNNFRIDNYVGCEKIEDQFCICFIPDINQEEIKILKQAIEIFRKGPNTDNIIDKFTVFRPRDFFILTEFFSRYGPNIRNNAC